MLNLSRRSRELRALSLLVAVVQLAAVTWVPVVHPRIHPDKALSTPLAAYDTPTSGSEQPVLGEIMCVACMVSPTALPSPIRLLTPAEPALKRQPSRESARRISLKSFASTHTARAPPSH